MCFILQAVANDGLSELICDKCLKLLKEFYHFKQMCLKSDETMRHIRDTYNVCPKEEEEAEEEDEPDNHNDDMDLEDTDPPDTVAEEVKIEGSDPSEVVKAELAEEGKHLHTCDKCQQVFETADLLNSHTLSNHIEGNVKKKKLMKAHQVRS